MDYSTLSPRYLKADTEQELQDKIDVIRDATGKMPQIITIYVRASKVVAWIMLDIRDHVEAIKDVEIDNKKKKNKKKGKKV